MDTYDFNANGHGVQQTNDDSRNSHYATDMVENQNENGNGNENNILKQGWNNINSAGFVVTASNCSNAGSRSPDNNNLPVPIQIGYVPTSAEQHGSTPCASHQMNNGDFQQGHDQQPFQTLDDLADDSYDPISLGEQRTVDSNHYLYAPLNDASVDLWESFSESGDAASVSIGPMHSQLVHIPMNPYHDHSSYQQEEQIKIRRKLQNQDDINEESKITKSVDELLAYELNKLSFQERELINEEIHGIGVGKPVVNETPELLNRSFHQLDLELNEIRSENWIFDRAQRLFRDTTWFNTEEFRIMFLRCDIFDCRKAAQRIGRFAYLMYEIHGDVGLQRRPNLTDFTDIELEFMDLGIYQILPGRDRAGRRMVANLGYDCPDEFGYLSRLRLGTYMLLSLLEDVETQQKGIVAISWWNNISVDDFLIRGKVHNRLNCMPMRVGAMHCCIPTVAKRSHVGEKTEGISDNESGMAQIIKAMFVFSIGSSVRSHFRLHTDSVIECIYALQSFGIHSDQLPITTSSEKWKTKHHLKWLELCRLKEESLKNNNGRKFDTIIECPNQMDILFGRGRPIMRHPGNAILRSIVESKLEEYMNAKNKKETTDVTWSVVRILKGKYGARFLKEENIESNGLGWVEVLNETARQKVRIAFRDLRTKISKTKAAETKEDSATGPETTNNETRSDNTTTKRKGDVSSYYSSNVGTTKTRPSLTLQSCLFQDDQESDKSLTDASTMSAVFKARKRRCLVIDCMGRQA